MKRILQISKYYYPFLGGTEQVARNIAIALSKEKNIEQKIICFNEEASDGKVISHKNETCQDVIDGVEVIRCGYQFKISSQAISFSYSKKLKNLMDNFNPDIVILHYPNPFVTRLLLKYKERKFKLWVYWHLDITKQYFLKRFFKNQNLELIRRADKILGATPKHLEESAYTVFFGDKKEILPYAIDESNLQISKDEILLASKIKKKYTNKVICFFIGRHVPYKGLQYLIDASKLINNDNVQFLIAGYGELTNELKKRADGDNKIEFIGRVSDSQRRIYLYACDIFCFPSITRNEGFGLALAEGMYFGKPAVTFSIPGSGVNYVNLNLITGIECPNKDIQSYAMAIKKLSEDHELRFKLGKAAQKRVKDNFTENRFNANILNLINRS